MEVKVCKNCRRLFQYITGPELCSSCVKLIDRHHFEHVENDKNEYKLKLMPLIKEDEEKLEQVKDYILSHPRASITQISEANDILPKKLFQWIREDRLQFSEDSRDAWFECDKCGSKIKSGRLCNRCK